MNETSETQAVPVEESPALEAADVAPPAVARIQTIEAWAEQKKLLPAFFPPPNYRAPGGAGGIARVVMSGMSGPVPNRQHYLFAQALAGERADGRWPEGKEVTEAEFDAATEKHNSHVCR